MHVLFTDRELVIRSTVSVESVKKETSGSGRLVRILIGEVEERRDSGATWSSLTGQNPQR
jgi:hypothetical protein